MEYGQTAHNRIVYASPPYGGSGYEKPCSGFALCTVFLRHSFLRPKNASHFPYRAQKTVIYNQDVRRKLKLNFLEDLFIMFSNIFFTSYFVLGIDLLMFLGYIYLLETDISWVFT